MYGSIGGSGSFVPFHGRVGSELVDTAGKQSATVVPAAQANHRSDNGLWRILGSLASVCGSRELAGSTFRQNSRGENRWSSLPVVLSCTTNPPSSKSTTCLGPTAPATSMVCFQ